MAQHNISLRCRFAPIRSAHSPIRSNTMSRKASEQDVLRVLAAGGDLLRWYSPQVFYTLQWPGHSASVANATVDRLLAAGLITDASGILELTAAGRAAH
jgi:hypothetical protein